MTDPVGHDGDRFVKELPERFNELGSFIREQRSSARLSLRRPAPRHVARHAAGSAAPVTRQEVTAERSRGRRDRSDLL